MFTQDITYTDFNGNNVTEKLYFNLSQPELIRLNLENSGKLKNLILSVQSTQDPGDIFTIIETIILNAYGVRSEDGKRFIKTIDGRPVSEEFKETAAYAALFDEFLADPNKIITFINNIAPAAMQAAQKAQVQTNVIDMPSTTDAEN